MSKPYNIFISWSGDRSKFVAEALNDWLPSVLQTARPWLSTQDIDKGTRSLSEMNKALNGLGFGISCLTPENLDARWILYEAGSLSKAFDDDKTRLWTYLLAGLQYQDVEQPLGQFQHTKAEKEDTRKLIHSINSAINNEEDRLKEAALNTIFDAMWPVLEKRLAAMPKAEGLVRAKRDSSEIMTEVLELCRRYLPQIEAVGTDSDEIVPLRSLSARAADIYYAATRDPLAGLTTANPKTFHVKLSNEKAVKEIVGTQAIEPHAGTLVVVGADGNVVARFTEGVEMWW